jgi:hypothetical protein
MWPDECLRGAGHAYNRAQYRRDFLLVEEAPNSCCEARRSEPIRFLGCGGLPASGKIILSVASSGEPFWRQRLGHAESLDSDGDEFPAWTMNWYDYPADVTIRSESISIVKDAI